MLVRSNDSGIEHHVLIIVVGGQVFEYAFENPALAPTPKSLVYVPPVAETTGKIAPRYAGAIAIKHRLNEQTIVAGRYTNMPFAPRKKVLDPMPLIVAQSITMHKPALQMPASYESSKI